MTSFNNNSLAKLFLILLVMLMCFVFFLDQYFQNTYALRELAQTPQPTVLANPTIIPTPKPLELYIAEENFKTQRFIAILGLIGTVAAAFITGTVYILKAVIENKRSKPEKERIMTCPPKTGPKPMLGLGRSGGRSNGKTEGIFSRTDHHETARGRSAAWPR